MPDDEKAGPALSPVEALTRLLAAERIRQAREKPDGQQPLPSSALEPTPAEALSQLLGSVRVRLPREQEPDQRPGSGGRQVEPAALSVTDAATYIGVSRRTMYRISAECGTGTRGIPVVHIGGRRVFRRVDLDAYLERNIISGR